MYMSFAYRFSVAMEICLYALFIILGLPTTFTGQPACRDNQEEFGFALVGYTKVCTLTISAAVILSALQRRDVKV